MEPNHPTLSALRKLHADLGGQLLRNEEAREKLCEDMRHVEAVIKLIAPNYDLRPIAVKRRRSNPYFKRGTIFRSVLELLRTAQEPLTASDITKRLLESKGAPNASRDDFRNLFSGVQASLRNNDGGTVRTVNEGKPARWALI